MGKTQSNLSIEPIHVANINDKPLRFFRSPIGNTDRDWYLWEECDDEPKPELPDFPWVAVMDLMACQEMPGEQQESILRKHEAPAQIVTIRDSAIRNGLPTDHALPCVKSFRTADGIVLIAPNVIASRSMMPRVHEETVRLGFIALAKGAELPVTPVHKFWMAYAAAFRTAVDIVTAGLSVSQLWSWLNGARERELLDHLAMGTAGRGGNKTTFGGLEIL
jgi:hypothetical protein